MLERFRQFIARHSVVALRGLAILISAVALHQFITSQNRVLTAWKGGGFGMYTTPHGVNARATFLIVDGHSLRLAPLDPAFEAWMDSVHPSSAAFLKRMTEMADEMRTYPRKGNADRLMRAAARVRWDGDLFESWLSVGKQPVSAMRVVVIEVARRPSVGVIESRIVLDQAGG